MFHDADCFRILGRMRPGFSSLFPFPNLEVFTVKSVSIVWEHGCVREALTTHFQTMGEARMINES